MTEEKKKRIPRANRRKPDQEVVDFKGYESVQAWLVERANANVRSISEEIVFRLKAAMRSAEAGFQRKA